MDGVYHGRAQLARMPFFDLERIEVLRGPQSTLFGKNSIAGALNLVSREPTDSFEAELSERYEPEFGENELAGIVSGPLTSRLRGRASLRTRESDGYITNSLLSRDEPSRDEDGIRLGLAWDVNDKLSIDFKAESTTFDVTGRQLEIVEDRPAASGPFAGLTYGQILAGVFRQPAAVLDHTRDYRRGSSGDFSNNDTEDGVLTIDWSVGELTLTSITGYSAYDYQELCDCDFTAANVFMAQFSEDFDQQSQELRITSPTGGAFEYLAGVYWQRNEFDFFDSFAVDQNSVLVALVNANPAIPRPPFPPLPGSTLLANTAAPRTFTQQAELAALFAHATWNASERWRVSFGARVTRETKEATRKFSITNLDGTPLNPLTAPLTVVLYNTLFNATPHSLAGEREQTKPMPSMAVEWDVSPSVLAYLSATKGFKSGGFDARSNNPPVNPLFPASRGSFEFDDEEAINLELGTKIRIGGGRGELYGALYDTDYKNLQVSTYDGTLGFNVGNAGEARARGVEVETRYRVTEDFTLIGGLALTDFEYREYFGQCYFGRLPDAPDGINCDYRGMTNQYTPDWSGIVSSDWRVRLGDRLTLRWNVDVRFTDDYLLSPTLNPDAVQDAYAKIDTRVSIGRSDRQWEIALIGTNLTDEETLSHENETPLAGTTFGAPGFFGFVDPPRSFALQGIFRFN